MTATNQAEQIRRKIAEIPVTQIEVASIHSDGKNPNKMREEQYQGLLQHIKANGILNPILVTENMILADGEHRVKAAKELGLVTIPGRIIPNDDRLRRILRQTMNKIHGTHDEALDAEEIPTTKPGDRILLGDHILVCGDATSKETWDFLLDGGKEQPAIMVTDPPYNVAYTGKTKDALTIQNDKMDEGHFKQFLLDFFRQAMERVKGAQYVFMSSSEWPTIHAAFTEAGGYWSTTIIWVKHHFAMGRKDYQTQHEPLYVGTALKELSKRKGAKASGQPILYGWKKGGTRQHYDTRTETDVWIADKPSRNEMHPTMKPVTLYRRAILMSSRPTDIIVDPFCGSGSAIIAAEQTHRRARAIELDPKYCDVIVKRWEEFTGRKAERL